MQVAAKRENGNRFQQISSVHRVFSETLPNISQVRRGRPPRLRAHSAFCYNLSVKRPLAMPMIKKKTPATGKTAVAPPPAAKAAPAKTAAKTVTASETQLKVWEHAVQLFTQRKFAEACAAFREAAQGPASHIADKARSYLQICERQTSTPKLDLRTAEDHFNYGVARLNARDVEQAGKHFERALALAPNGDHILYTLALCCGMSGDGDGACENLKRAISLDPRNRILARQDPEFTALFAQFPALRSLLGNDGY